MNYKEAREYIKKASQYGIVPGLDNISNLCDKLGNPQNELDVIHIAGTNGKGSVGAFAEQILIESGKKVGRYVSPSVFDYLEQFRINAENMIDRCQIVVDAGVHIGSCNHRMRNLLQYAQEKGKLKRDYL